DVLARTKDASAIPALLENAARDTDWWAAETCVQAVGSLGDARAVPHLTALLTQRPELALVVVETLGTLRAGGAADNVLPLLRSPDPDLRVAVLGFLEATGIRHVDAVKALASDPAPEVRTRVGKLLTFWQQTTARVDAR